jgi:hypothetical protein
LKLLGKAISLQVSLGWGFFGGVGGSGGFGGIFDPKTLGALVHKNTS